MKKILITLLAVFSIFSSAVAQTSITANIPYQSAAGTGTYGIVSANATSLSQVDKPIILVEGLDLTNAVSEPYTYGFVFNLPTTNYLGSQLKSLGYDVVVLNFTDGGDFIQRNAFVLVELINQINAQKQGNEKITVIGLSTGGLIARYALAYMEANTMNHNVGLYASIDAPHIGANIPAALQFMMKRFAAGLSIPANFATAFGFDYP